jgi:DNA-directed RNA polymerase subunit RPC12/RpoP
MKNLNKCPHCGAEDNILRVEDATIRQCWTGQMNEDGEWEDKEHDEPSYEDSETVMYQCDKCNKEVYWDDDNGFGD